MFFFQRSKLKFTNNSVVQGQLNIPRFVMWITLVLFIILFFWANYAELDQVTRASGSIIASSRTQVIQSQDGGTIEELLVKEGDRVKAGQILARIDRKRIESSYLEGKAKEVGLEATAARLRAEIYGGEIKFSREIDSYPKFKENQKALFKERKIVINEELASLTKLKALAQQELEMNLPLVESGDIGRAEVLRLQRQVADLQSQIANKRNKYLQDVQAELSKTEEELAGVKQNLAQRKDQLDRTLLIAPVPGIIKNVRLTTVGGVLRPGDELMQIVPIDDDLVVEARVYPKDIAFLSVGQNAKVKIDAYDYTVYGDLPGRLTFISADTLTENLRQNEEPYYRVHVRTSGREFSKNKSLHLEMLPGMTATVEFQMGRKTVLQYITKPIIKTMNDSLKEK